jgi:hypothetical protein
VFLHVFDTRRHFSCKKDAESSEQNEKNMNSEGQDRDFEVVDKRRVTPDEPQEAEEAASASEEGEEAPPEPLDLWGLLRYTVGLLYGFAWQAMGLVPNPVSGKIEPDFEQARVAIDCAADMVRRMEEHVGEEERLRLRSLVGDLRLNFVQQKERAEKEGN